MSAIQPYVLFVSKWGYAARTERNDWGYLSIPNFFSYTSVVFSPSMGSGVGMPQIPDFRAPVAPSQVQTCAIDFGNFLPSGVTLSGTPSLNVTVSKGYSSDPNNIINGSPTIGSVSADEGGTGLNNTAVLFQVKGCEAGLIYTIEVTCARSDNSDIVEGWTHLTCIAPS